MSRKPSPPVRGRGRVSSVWRVIGLVVARLTRHEIEPVLLGGVDGGQGLVVGLVSLIFPEDHLL